MMIAGALHPPPVFSFSSRRKRENGPCTVQKRKRSNLTFYRQNILYGEIGFLGVNPYGAP